MGSGPDADVVSAGPVNEIVARFGARRGMIRDFVCGHPARLAEFLGQIEHVRREIFVGQVRQPAPGKPLAEDRPRLDRQLVEGQVVRRHFQGFAELATP